MREYRFGRCRLNEATRELWRDSVLQPVPPRVMDLLLFFLRHPDRVVTKEELIEEVWSGAVVSDGVLGQAVMKLRKAIGDESPDAGSVKTVHRVGYRFVARIDALTNDMSSRTQSAPLKSASAPRVKSQGLVGLLHGAAISGTEFHYPLTARKAAEALRAGQSVPVAPIADAGVGLFALEDDMSLREAALPALEGAEKLGVLVLLAWHGRQRNCQRAIAWADEAERYLITVDDKTAGRCRARLTLVRAEIELLGGHLAPATALADRALEGFLECADATGACDAETLRAHIARTSTNLALRDEHLQRAAAHAMQSGDAERSTFVQLLQASAEALRDAERAVEVWGDRVRGWQSTASAGILARCENFWLLRDYQAGDLAASISRAQNACSLSLQVGEWQEAIRLAGNLADDLAVLSDHERALDWLNAALETARLNRWPLSMANCLTRAVQILTQLDRMEEAQELMAECWSLLSGSERTCSCACALVAQRQLHCVLGERDEALVTSHKLVALARELANRSLEVEGLIALSESYLLLDDAAKAHATALDALQFSRERGMLQWQFMALEVLAEIHARHPLKAPAGCIEPTASLHYLLEAIRLRTSIKSDAVPSAVYSRVADEYARLGRHAQAHFYLQEAFEAWKRSQSEDACKIAIAMQARYQIEKARAETELQRQLAASHAERANALIQINTTLDRVTTVGQEIANQLEPDAVFDTLNRHLHVLLSTSAWALFELAEGGTALAQSFGIKNGKPLAMIEIALDDPQANIARCARERREISVDYEPELTEHPAGAHVPTMRSALFTPLMIGPRLLGVLTIQSAQRGAYSDRDRLVVRMLSAYAAIALDNSKAYGRLRGTTSKSGRALDAAHAS